MLIVLALGMRGTLDDALSLFRRPGLLLRSLLAMNVVLPIVAAATVAVADLNPVVEVALVALSVSPVPPILPGKELRLVSDEAYVYGLLVAVAVLSIVIVPVTISLFGLYFGRDVRVEPAAIARIVAMSILVPLAAGMALRHLWPELAAKLSPVANAVGMGLLLALSLLVLAAQWDALRSLIGDGTFGACVLLAAVGLAAGHLFGGADRDHQTTLALATASRHPGVAITLGAAAEPGNPLVPVAVVLYVLVSVVVAIPYTAWRRRGRPSDPSPNTRVPGSV
jgi:BASS family bile acid:Na+ symporter